MTRCGVILEIAGADRSEASGDVADLESSFRVANSKTWRNAPISANRSRGGKPCGARRHEMANHGDEE